MNTTPESHPPEFRQTVTEFFNIFQATIAMLAIFNGFVFSSLFSILTNSDKIDTTKTIAIWFLIAAMVLLMTALISFHASAHRVIRYWGIFFPVSIYVRLGRYAMEGGLVAMFACISVLLWSRGLTCAAAVVAIFSVGIVVYAKIFQGMHRPDAPYLTKVDKLRAKQTD